MARLACATPASLLTSAAPGRRRRSKRRSADAQIFAHHYDPAGVDRAGVRPGHRARTVRAGNADDESDRDQGFCGQGRQGQLGAVARMLEEGRSCDEVIHQMSAVSKAVNTAAFTLISASLEECIIDGKSNQKEVSEKLQKLFLSLA